MQAIVARSLPRVVSAVTSRTSRGSLRTMATSKQVISTTKAPAALGPYSQAIKAGSTVGVVHWLLERIGLHVNWLVPTLCIMMVCWVIMHGFCRSGLPCIMAGSIQLNAPITFHTNGGLLINSPPRIHFLIKSLRHVCLGLCSCMCPARLDLCLVPRTSHLQMWRDRPSRSDAMWLVLGGRFVTATPYQPTVLPSPKFGMRQSAGETVCSLCAVTWASQKGRAN